MATNLREFLARKQSAPSSTARERCVICRKALNETGQLMETGRAHDACYFDALGDLVEQRPYSTRVMHPLPADGGGEKETGNG